MTNVSGDLHFAASSSLLKTKHHMSTKNKQVVKNFIEEAWNNDRFDIASSYLHAGFRDYSLPPALENNMEGTKRWIEATGKSFRHHTVIEEMVSEEDKVMIKIKMQLKHIGVWREIEPTEMEIETTGYRLFKLNNEQITEHWGLLDGNAIENQLKDARHGCKIQR